MKNLLLQLFTWWNGQTLGTRFFTWRFGNKVGQDEFGNTYYEGSMSSYGLPRRFRPDAESRLHRSPEWLRSQRKRPRRVRLISAGSTK